MNTLTATIQSPIIKLYPNPTSDYIQISGFDNMASLTISDLNCMVWLKKQIISDEYISLARLKKGVYVAKIITSFEIIERKLIKT